MNRLARAQLAIACALALGVIRPAPAIRREPRSHAETQRRAEAAESKRARRRARNLAQQENAP